MPRTAYLTLLSLVLCLAPNSLTSAGLSSVGAAEPNDTFGDATVLPAGILTVSDMLSGGSGLVPDTYLGFFADDTFSVPPLAEDDDSSPLGDGLADGLFGISVNADGSIPLAVTGCCDDFSGAHSEEGDYELFVEVFDSSGASIDFFSETSTLASGAIDEYPFSASTWIGATFDAFIDNTVGLVPGSDPLDFWAFTGLTPGASYVAEVTAGDFDTILALFAADGTLAEVDDDMGEGLLSRLDVTAPANGELVLAVTGFADFAVTGLHTESGSYELTLSKVPEPSTLVSITAGLLTCLALSTRRS